MYDGKSCLVDIAHDYSRKRKNVFRLTTYTESVYLLQAEDKGTMMSWIQAIKTNNNPDNDDEGIGSADLIRRKASTQSDGVLLQTSPQTSHKEKDKEKEKVKKTTMEGRKAGRVASLPRSFRKHTADDGGDRLEWKYEAWRWSVCIVSRATPWLWPTCKEELNRGIENMNMDNDKWLDVNVVSSLLKAFLRKLPHPLVTPDLYDAFIEANRNPNPEKRMLKLKRLLHTLPEHHYETFKHLAEHLSRVASNGHLNKERNIDAAVQRSISVTKSQSSLASSLSASEEGLDRRATAPLATSEPDFLDWEERHPYAGRGRHMSDDALLERSDEVEVGGWVGQNTLDWLKRLEQEARTIRRLEEQRQRDMERRRRQQQAIERELQRSQRDLELEDAHTVEDILAWPSSKDCAPTTSAWSSAPRTTFAPLTFNSLLDLIDKREHQQGDSDSEDGSDLLTSLTTTFDQKLQILLNPKYRLTARHSRLPNSQSRSNAGATMGVSQGTDGVLVGQQKGAGWQDEASGAERVKKDRRKRRHTLGGTCDLDHFKALLAVNGSQVDNRPRFCAVNDFDSC
nr:hypothetical protein BaRGS_009850 [Batillaria attramentaria]